MAIPYIPKFSNIPGKRPNNNDLNLGELAVNAYDARLFLKSNKVGIGTTVTLINPWSENLGGSSYYTESNVGIGTTNPTSKLTVIGGDVKIGVDTSSGVVLTSPNGNNYRLVIDNSGNLSTTLVS